MAERIWDKFLTDRDKQVFETAGYGATAGGGKKPALLIIDVNYNFCGERPEPILESIEKWRNSCGEDAWQALPNIRNLIDKCHAKGIPVIYTTGTVREDGWDKGGWAWKSSRSGSSTSNASRTRETSWVASNEWPPSAKKSSSTPTRSTPSTSDQMAASRSSTGLRGAT